MKNLWLFFSILILTLSVLPCSDTIECNDKTKTEITQQDNHEKHNHNSEQCPPFCSCACCGVNVFQFQNPVYSFKKDLVFINQKEKINFYSFIYNKKIAHKIWQPPKIS